jgi:hypothetical protein
MSEFREIGKLMRVLLEGIRRMPRGAARDNRQRRFDAMVERLKTLPKRVALQAPFADCDDAASVLETEMEWVLSAFEAD